MNTHTEKPLNNQKPEDDREIDLLEIGVKLWARRRRIFIWAGWGALIGLIIAFSIPREYTSTVVLVPETEENTAGSSRLNALASFAGMNLGAMNSTDALSPDVYPDIVSSTPFVTELFDIVLPTDIEGKDSLTLYQIITEESRAPWWSVIMSLPGKAIGGAKKMFKGKQDDTFTQLDPFRLTAEQDAVAKAVRGIVGTDYDNKTGVITVTATLQDPLASACLVDTVAQHLQTYITHYRTTKARHDLEYARKINDEARDAYYKAQQDYARYSDRNQGLSSRSASIEQERLQNEASLAFNLYNSTAQQLQLAEAKVQSNTPVFAVVQPASVPTLPSKPRKALILIAFVFLAVVAACAYILFAPDLISNIREKKDKLSSTPKHQER